jgi:predicted protein tyrosine phosphatase
MNLLFCSENRLRSSAGEEVFSGCEGIASIGCETNADALTTISGDLIEWADIILRLKNSLFRYPRRIRDNGPIFS